MDQTRSVPLGRQALSLSVCESVGAAAAETASADLDSRSDQPGDGEVVRGASLSVRGIGDAAWSDARDVQHVRQARGRIGLSGGAGEFRLPAAGVLRRYR